ncbi:MAG: hypothetical protein MJH10_11475 [Epibacterium sp.]|nr:hypothetical protein [Epibacterium sp.]NQX74167.1 hypothetical protein [Epibacterium sp.]
MKLSRDINGNKTLVITKKDLGGARGFSVQVSQGDYFKETKRMTNDDFNRNTATNELHDWVKVHGTSRQQSLLGW